MIATEFMNDIRTLMKDGPGKAVAKYNQYIVQNYYPSEAGFPEDFATITRNFFSCKDFFFAP